MFIRYNVYFESAETGESALYQFWKLPRGIEIYMRLPTRNSRYEFAEVLV